VRAARETRESKNAGAITYINGNAVYRASINALNKIETGMIFQFPANAQISDF